MTLKISYSKHIKENLKHRAWLIAFSFIALFLLMPVYALFMIDTQKTVNVHSSDLQMLKDWAQNNYSGLFNGNSNILIIIFIVGIGLICGVTGFSYLHSKVKQDFYHSMAVTRTQWFFISYISGLLIFLVPYFVCSLCSIVIGEVNGLMNVVLLRCCLEAMLYGTMAFLISYHTSILAMMLTGQIITGVLAYIVILVYGSAVIGLSEILCDTFFSTWVSDFSIFSRILPYSSPVALIATFTTFDVTSSDSFIAFTRIQKSSANYFIVWIAALLFLALLFWAARLLYKKYPAEAAENALAFPKTGGIIKVFIAIPSALAVGLFSNVFFGVNFKNHWLFTMSILFVFLICFIIEFIYHHDLKMVLCGKLTTLISFIGVLVILCVFRFDLFGYNSHIPKESSLKSMSVYCGNGYYDYQFLQHDIERIMKLTTTTDFHDFYEVAKTGLKHNNLSLHQNSYIEDAGANDLYSIIVRFDRKSSSPIYRTYNVERDALLKAYEHAYEDPGYRKKENPAFQADNKNIAYFTLEDIYNTRLALDKLTVEQRNNLFDAYKKDFLATDFHVFTDENAIAKLYVGLKTDFPSDVDVNTTFENTLYIYKNFSNTLQLLNEYGYTIREKIDIKDVLHMTYHPSDKDIQESDGNDTTPRVISDTQEIQKYLDRLSLSENCRLLDKNVDYYETAHISISLNNGSEIYFNLTNEN